MPIPYDQQTIASRSGIKRWSHARRFELACELLAPRPGERILDYGTGDATLLNLLGERQPSAVLVGFEPFMTEAARRNAPARATILSSPEGLTGFDKVACLEVLEHVAEPALTSAIDTMMSALRPGGMMVVSVPIEVGPSALVKTLVRAAVGAPHPNTTVGSTLLSVLGRTNAITRRAQGGYIGSHVGFDWRALRQKLLRRGLREKRIVFSPVRQLGGLLNSQVTMLLAPA
jgi:SAM-dependent methyltransferase